MIAKKTARITLGIIALATLGYVIAFAANLSPYLRGPAEWRWTYAIPGVPVRHLLPILVVSAYVTLIALWNRVSPASSARPQTALPYLIVVALCVPLIQAALLFPESPDVLRPLLYRTISPGASGVFSVGATISDPGDYLRRYPELMPTFPVHPQRYPPGLPLLFYTARQLFTQFPALADSIGFALRRYLCHDLALMQLSNATLASAVIQMASPLLAGLTVFPLYGLARRSVGDRAARWAVALYPLVPSFMLWSARWDQVHPLLSCATWYFFYEGLTQSRRGWLALSGMTLALATFFSFGPLVMLMPMGLAALLWALPHPERRRWGHLTLDALIFFASLIGPWLIYQLAFGNGFLDIWRVSMGYHLGLARDYWTWVGFHLYDFFAFLGLPLALLGGVALLRSARAGLRDDRGALPLGFALGLLLLNLSGTARGEVARVWLFLTPFAVLCAAYGLTQISRKQRALAVVAALLAIQLLTFNAFLRVVTTGVVDPPQRSHVWAAPAPSQETQAQFGESLTLHGYDLDIVPTQPGETLQITFHWQSSAPMAQPYTAFVHLLASDGTLIAQHDGMPQDGRAPTTCWIPGEMISDTHSLLIPADTPPGTYTLQVGYYYLGESAERLPARGPNATAHDSVSLTTLTLNAPENNDD